MSTTITIDEAQATLKNLIHQLAPGDEVIITENQQPVAKLLSEPAKQRKPRTPGNCKGMITLLVEDDQHLEGFADYMP
jgi:antitoxin (DNA-binding transcriptional repressor) of toxin-antitoxin stability system